MQALNRNKAVVLFSGGQDSSISLAWALEKFERVETIGFDYGQRVSDPLLLLLLLLLVLVLFRKR